MPLPTITIIGNLTADPELRFTQAGKPWVTFTIAANERRKTETGEWVDGDTCFMDITSWRSAEQISRELRKGSRAIVVGTLKQREYDDKDGNKRKAFQVNADYVASQISENAVPRTITGHDEPAPIPATDPWAAAGSTDASAPF